MALIPVDSTPGNDLLSDVYAKINLLTAAVNELQGGTADQIYKKTNSTDFNFEACNSILPASGTANLKIKVVEIGDWNMDSSDAVTVDIGVSREDIRMIQAMIRSDLSSGLVPLNSPQNFTGGSYGGGVENPGGGIDYGSEGLGGTSIILSRATSGVFDTTDYNATAYNRGYVTVIYEG